MKPTMLWIGILLFAGVVGKTQSVFSPNKKIELRVQVSDRIYYSVLHQGQTLLWYSPLALTLHDGHVLGQHPILTNQSSRSVRQSISPVWGTKASIPEQYNELTLDFEQNFSVVFRAYDDGVAYRFVTHMEAPIKIQDELVEYRFLENFEVTAQELGTFASSYENLHVRKRLLELDEKNFAALPFIVHLNNGLKVAIVESDVVQYPGMYLRKKNENNRTWLNGLFPKYPLRTEIGGWSQFNMVVTERASYIAQTEGKHSLPWRAMIIAENDKQLADNDLVYKLARPATEPTDWIKPGKVAWDWWNDWNLEGVNFETGINNRTYEYYIDFAARNKIEYVILDEGWSDQFDLFLFTPHVDVRHLAKYAASKNVGLILWCVWHTIDRQMTAALDSFQRWGIKGIKVDFIDRDDQLAIEFYERLAKEAAKRKLLVDYHGCSKPTGLHRTYPNVVNFEAVRGNEYNKFGQPSINPKHNVQLAFTRMLAGPMDYTPGAMRNSTDLDFVISNSQPMAKGTRCHQLGMYVVYHAPLQMLCDAPTAYERYPDILSMLSAVPVSWHETRVLEAKFGEYVVIARRKGSTWWIGGIGDWHEHHFQLDLSFMGRGTKKVTVAKDGVNANRLPSDYIFEQRTINLQQPFAIAMKKGGGFLMKIE